MNQNPCFTAKDIW